MIVLFKFNLAVVRPESEPVVKNKKIRKMQKKKMRNKNLGYKQKLKMRK
jgi:hypothetical protein